MGEENAALVTGRDERDCPACRDADDFGQWVAEVYPSGELPVVRCRNGHRYSFRSSARRLPNDLTGISYALIRRFPDAT